MLEVDGVQYEIKGRKILSDIYLKAETGSVTGIVGRNGCGKTTLLNIIFGSLKADYASIRMDGLKLKQGINPSYIQYLPQFTIFPENLTVEKVGKMYEANLSDFVRYFKFPHLIGQKKIGTLSKGTQRLLECYILIQRKCQVVLLDEPFSFVMPIHIEKIKQLIEQEKQLKTIIISDHMFQHVQSISDCIYLIKDGRSITIQRQEDLIQYGYLPEIFFD